MGEDDAQEGENDFPPRIMLDVLEMLDSEEYHQVDIGPYPYVGLYWTGFPKIFFTLDEPRDERGNIIIMFELL